MPEEIVEERRNVGSCTACSYWQAASCLINCRDFKTPMKLLSEFCSHANDEARRGFLEGYMPRHMVVHRHGYRSKVQLCLQ